MLSPSQLLHCSCPCSKRPHAGAAAQRDWEGCMQLHAGKCPLLGICSGAAAKVPDIFPFNGLFTWPHQVTAFFIFRQDLSALHCIALHCIALHGFNIADGRVVNKLLSLGVTRCKLSLKADATQPTLLPIANPVGLCTLEKSWDKTQMCFPPTDRQTMQPQKSNCCTLAT